MAPRHSFAFSVFASFLCLCAGVPAQAPDGFAAAGRVASWPVEGGGAVLPGPDPLLALAGTEGLAFFRRGGSGPAATWMPDGGLDGSVLGIAEPRVEGVFHRFADQWLLFFSARGPEGGRGLWALSDPGRGKPASVMWLRDGSSGDAEPSWSALRAEGGRAVIVMAQDGDLEALILGPAPAQAARRARARTEEAARVLDAFVSADRCVAVVGDGDGSGLFILDYLADQPRWEGIDADTAVADLAFLGRRGREGQDVLAFGDRGSALLLSGWGAEWKEAERFGPGFRAWAPLPGQAGGLGLFERTGRLFLEGRAAAPESLGPSPSGPPGSLENDFSLTPWLVDGAACLLLGSGGRALWSIGAGDGDRFDARMLAAGTSSWIGRGGACLLQEEEGLLRLADGAGSREYGFSRGPVEAQVLLAEGELLVREGAVRAGPPRPPLRLAYSRLGRMEEGTLLSMSVDGGGLPRFLVLADGSGGAFLHEAEARP